jgi:hypothetical protein
MVVYLGADRSAYVHVQGVDPVSGTWSWNPTSQVGGIVTITYSRVGFTNRLYYSITFIDQDNIVLEDPYFSINMQRR